MKTNQLRQSIVPAVLVAAVAFSVWRWLDRPMPDAAPQPVATFSAQPVPAPTPGLPAIHAASDAPLVSADTAPTLPEGKKAIFSKPKSVTGQALDLRAVEDFNVAPQTLRGRSAELEAASFASLNDLAEGDAVSFPSFDGVLHGVVEVAVVEENGWKRVGGPLEGNREKGWFSFGYDGREAVGLVRLHGEKLAYQISRTGSGALQMTERPLKDFLCLGMPPHIPLSKPKRRAGPVNAHIVTPILNSRLGAVAVLFMDFDGANVNDPDWGRINAPESPLTAVQRADVFRRVKDDFLAFNINVTTDKAKYAAAPVGSRMRCIVTTNDAAAPGSGGVAYLNSFAYAGTVFSANIPCWCFNPTVKSIADTISHEVGHTLGLNHDGQVGVAEYYLGHGTGPTSWGPIMGAPFVSSVSQWSKGEYAGANNYEFDLEIIANSVNAFGFAPDDFGDTPATSSPIAFSGTIIDQRGVIDRIGDADVFSITLPNGGGVLVSAAGLGNQVGNLDLRLELLDAAGTVLASNKLDKSLGAGLNVSLAKGTSYLRVRAAGDGDVDKTGYSKYGSNGAYSIAGRLPP